MTFRGREARVDFNTLPYCFRLACVRWNQHNWHYLTMTRFLLKWLLVSVLMIGTSCTRKASEIPAPEVPKLTLAERAAKGDAAAQCELGVMYAQGKGVPQDGERAEMWLERAADQGYVRAQYNIGYAYLTGTGVEKNPVQAARWFQKAAERGDAKAQATLGGMYAAGEGIEHDPVEAVKWFRKAAEQGDAPAQDRVGTAYAAGNGVDKDYAQAATWFRMAADQGLAQGQKDLGILYAEGLGVTQDANEAIKWFRKAADQGDTEAQAKLTELTKQAAVATDDVAPISTRETGTGVESDFESKVAGIYEYSKRLAAYDNAGVPITAKFTLELRSDKSFIYTKDTGMPSYMPNGLGSSRTTGTWKASGAVIVLVVDGHDNAKLTVEGIDLINSEGTRFLRTR